MRNPSSAKAIAPKSGVKLVASYTTRDNKVMNVFDCDDREIALEFEKDQIRLGNVVGRVDCRVCVKEPPIPGGRAPVVEFVEEA